MATASATANQAPPQSQKPRLPKVLSSAGITTVPWHIGDALVVFVLPWILLPLVLVVLLSLLAPDVPGGAIYLHALAQGDPSATFGLVIVDAVGSIGTITFFLRKYQAGPRQLGLRSFSLWRTVGYLALIALSFTFLVAAAYWLAQLIDPHFNASQAQTNEFTGHPSLVNLLALVIIPPLVEEPTFRGFIFPAFARRYGTIIGALATSVLFGVAHLQGNVSVYTFILSLLLCWLYTRIGSIIPGIGLHMLNNYLAYMSMNQK